MDLGKIIYFHRKKKNITQQELCHGICSVTHLSKIENSGRDANIETLKLLCDRLDISISEESEKVNNYYLLLEEFYDSIVKLNETRIHKLYNLLKDDMEFIECTDLVFTFQLYITRYYLHIDDLEKAENMLTKLSKNSNKLTKFEINFYDLLKAIYQYKLGKLLKSVDTLSRIKLDDQEKISQEYYYYLSLIYSLQNISSKALFFANIALELFKRKNNIVRIIQTNIIIANQLIRNKEYNYALKILENTRFDAELINASNQLPIIYNNLGYIHSKLKNYKEAIRQYNKALNFYESKSDDYYNIIENIVKNELIMNNIKKATNTLEYELKQFSGDQNTLGFINLKIIQLQLIGNKEKLFRFLTKIALPKYKEVNDIIKVKKYTKEIIKYIKESEDYSELEKYLEEFCIY